MKVFSVAVASTAASSVGCGDEGESDAADDPHGPVPAGNVSDLVIGEPRVLDQPLVVYRDAGGVYAMTTICTHARCDIRKRGAISASGLACNCHGSTFDAVGAVTQGPALKPLAHFSVEIDPNGEMIVQADAQVSADTRTPVV